MGVCVRSQREPATPAQSTECLFNTANPGAKPPHILPDHSPQGAPQRASILLSTNYLRTTKKQYPNKVYNAM